MSGNLQLEYPVLHIRWKRNPRKPEGFRVDLTQDDGVWSCRFSKVIDPKFTFQGERWFLSYRIYLDLNVAVQVHPIRMMMNDHLDDPRVERGEHSLWLRKLSDGPNGPIHVSVHVEAGSSTERIVVDGLSCQRRIGSDETSTVQIWRQSVIDVKRMHPRFRRNGRLRFLVELKKDDVPKAKDTATQTKYNIPKGFQLHCMDNLSEDFAQMMVQDSDTDVEFRCEGQSFRAHGPVVCVRSPVIASMLSSDMVEGRTRVIKISDMTPELFQIFLRYLYTGKTPELTFEVAWTLYEFADQYAVLGLARRCSMHLVEQLSDQNVWDVLVLADAHHDEGFLKEVVDYMVDRKILETNDRFWNEHRELAIKVAVLELGKILSNCF